MRKIFKMSFLFAAAAAVGLGAAMPASAAPNVPFNGSGFESTFAITAGQTVSFQYQLVTASNTAAPGFQDFAYYTFDSAPSVHLIATENSATIANNDLFLGGFRTGVQTVTFTATANGTLGFGVVNVGDGTTGTALLVDNIKVNNVVIPNGGFAGFPDFLNYTTVGNATIFSDSGALIAPDFDGAQALISNVTLNGGPPPVSIAVLEAGTNVQPPGALGTLALQVNAAAVPLPTGMYLAPLGLILAGVYSRKLRRTAAC